MLTCTYACEMQPDHSFGCGVKSDLVCHDWKRGDSLVDCCPEGRDDGNRLGRWQR